MNEEVKLAIKAWSKVKNVSITLAVVSSVVAIGFTLMVDILKNNEEGA